MSSISKPASSQTVPPSLPALVLAFVIAIGAILGFGILAFTFGKGLFLTIDQRALWSAFELRELDPQISPLMTAATNIGSNPIIAVQGLIALGVLFWRKPQDWRGLGLRLTIITAGAMLLFVALKYQIARPRPSLYPSPYHLTTYSFPSGHSLVSSSFYGGIVQVFAPLIERHWRRWLLIVGCAMLVMLIGLSRMFFSVHYPTDVMGGFIGGIAWLFANQSIWQTMQWRKSHRPLPVA